jgi:aryl-alcohol dehydrogenase
VGDQPPGAIAISAAVLRSPTGRHVMETVYLAPPAEDEILVRIHAAGFCHSDVLPRDARFTAFPLIVGHEGAGIVERVGARVSRVAVGDHVVLTFQSCGHCQLCASGKPSYCDSFVKLNASGRNGDGSTCVRDARGEEISARWFGQSSFATHALATERNAVVVDRDLPLTLVAPLGCGIQSGAGAVMVTFDMKAGESLVVFGAGSVGLSAVLGARAVGASTIVAVDLHRARLDMALEFGATHVFDAGADDLVAKIRQATGGGAHYAFDTTGVPSVISKAIAAIRKGGACGLVGAPTGELVISQYDLNGKALMRIVEGGVEPHVFIPKMIALWKAGSFPFDKLIQTFPLSQINEAEQSSLSGLVIKPVLVPDEYFAKQSNKTQ